MDYISKITWRVLWVSYIKGLCFCILFIPGVLTVLNKVPERWVNVTCAQQAAPVQILAWVPQCHVELVLSLWVSVLLLDIVLSGPAAGRFTIFRVKCLLYDVFIFTAVILELWYPQRGCSVKFLFYISYCRMLVHLFVSPVQQDTTVMRTGPAESAWCSMCVLSVEFVPKEWLSFPMRRSVFVPRDTTV